MKKINKLSIIFVLMFVFAFSVFAADYATPDDSATVKTAISEVTVNAIASQPYTGSAVMPNVTVTYKDVALVEGRDYTVTYVNNTKIGTARVKLEGIGNYEGTKEVTFKILKNISSAKVSGVKTKTYTGAKQTQNVVVKYGSAKLKNGKDYTISYSNNINAGTATITITGKGSYAGTKNVTFKIARRSISKLTFSKVKNYTYTGKAITPSVTVKYGKKVLAKDTDYTVSYSKNVSVGTATLTITGKGNFSGTKKMTFKINKRSISATTIEGLKSKTYTGSKQYQSLTLTYNGITLKKDKDYTLSYKKNVNSGKATVTIKGKGNFTGSIKKTFKIFDRNINELTVTSATSKVYTGSQIKPSVTVKYGSKKLKINKDYTVKYSNNTSVGAATITVTGKGNYAGTKKLTFEITKRSITSVKIKGLEDKTYTGGKLTQSLKLTYSKKTLKNGKDYTLEYANNVSAGTATVTIIGKGNFYGEKTLTYKIARRSISKLSFSKVSNYTYTGKDITPAVTVKYGKKALVKDTDYTVSYSKNMSVGTATITIIGKGNFSGTKKITFKINKRSISSVEISGLISKIYTGSKQYQNLTLTYNGITLKKDTHYTISYKNNTSIGIATVTITGKGNFTGSKVLTFKINPQTPTANSAVATDKNIKVSWTKVSNATGYEVYMTKDGETFEKIATITKNSTLNYTVKNLDAGEYGFKVRAYKTVGKAKYYGTYSEIKTASIVVITVPVPTITFGEKVTGPDSSVQYTVLIENTTELDGIQVYYATSENGEYKLQREYSKSDIDSYDIAVEIPLNKHYYFKVRGYKTVNNSKVYGNYSKVIDYNNVSDVVIYIMGEDIQPGTYKITPIDKNKQIEVKQYISPEEYEQMQQGGYGGISPIITFNSGYITFEKYPKEISIKNGVLQKVNLEDIPVNIKTTVSNGTYLVGKDIEPGTYKVTTNKEEAIVNVFNSFIFSYADWTDECIQNGYIEITDKQVAVNIVDGTLEKVDLTNYPVNIKTKVSDGMYFVGKDLEPGTYKVTQSKKLENYSNICMWGKYINYLNVPQGYIEISKETEKINLLHTTLEKVDLDEVETNIQTTISEDGVYLVGKDIEPGIYKYAKNDGITEEYGTSITRYSDLLLDYSSIITNTYYPYGYFEVKDTDVAIEIIGVTINKIDYNNLPENIQTKVSDGAYIVGKDIAEGVYKVTQRAEEECYVLKLGSGYLETMSGYTGSVLTNNGYIEVTAEDSFVIVENGTLEKIDIDSIETNIQNKVGQGMYIVGKEIDTGTYKVTAQHIHGEICLLKSLTGSHNDDYDFAWPEKGASYIEIDENVYAISISKGITIEKIDLSNYPTNIKDTVADGTHIVGKDITPGTYKIESTGDRRCSVSRYSSVNMIYSNLVESAYLNKGYIQIDETDVAVNVSGGTITKINLDDLKNEPQTKVSNEDTVQMYLVGKEIEPGTYKITGKSGEYCWVNTFSKLSMAEEFETGSFYGKSGYITINESDIAVTVSYATIEKVQDESETEEIKDTVTDGMYLVGKDIAPGIYKVTANMSYSSVRTYSSITTEYDYQTDVFYGKRGYIEVKETDVSVVVEDATITKVDIETMPEDIKDSASNGMYLVGKEIAPGTYRMIADENSYCWVNTYPKITTDYNSKNNFIQGEAGFIEIKDTDVVVSIEQGTITKVDVETMPENIQKTVSKGAYIVGKELAAGVYKINDIEAEDYAEVLVFNALTTNYENRINEFRYKSGYIEIKDTDVAVVVSSKTTMTKINVDELPADIKDTLTSHRMYLVGKDIAPGTYKVIPNENNMSVVDVYSAISTNYQDVSKNFANREGYIEITATDVAVKIEEGTMVKIDFATLPVNTPTTLTNGMYIVGKDIAPGVYMTVDYANVTKYSSETSSLLDLVSTGYIGVESGYIEVEETDFIVNVYGTINKLDLDNITPNYEDNVSDGMYMVGKDIAPGVYRVVSDYYDSTEDYKFHEYVRIYDGFNVNNLQPIHEFGGLYGYIEVKDTDTIVTVSGGIIEKVDLNNLPEDIKSTYEMGIYIVGKDIMPGTYTVTGSDFGCAKKLSSINASDVVDEAYSAESTIVITESDYAVYLDGAKLERVEETQQPQTMQLSEEVVEAENSQQETEEVNIYNEVDIYSEN